MNDSCEQINNRSRQRTVLYRYLRTEHRSYRADSVLILAGDGTINCLVRSIIHDSLLENRVGRSHKGCSCRDEGHTNSDEDGHHFKRGHDGLPSLQPLLSEIITGRSVGLHWLGHDVRINFISGRNLEQAREIK